MFGLEICLDHALGYVSDRPEAVTGRLAVTKKRVDIQLVPSSLSLAPARNPCDPTSYAFNCDGLSSVNKEDVELGGHVQLWDGVKIAGEYQVDVLQEVQSIYDDPDQTPPPDDDPTQSRHFSVPDDDIDLSNRVFLLPEFQAELGIDLHRISPNTLWRSHKDAKPGEDPHTRLWPEGLGFIRRLPPVML